MQDYQYNQNQNFHPVLARNAAVSIAGIWQKLGRQDSTLHYLHESERLDAVHKEKEPMWKEQRDEQFHINDYEVFLEYYKAKGNARMAYDYLDSLTCLRNETNLRYNTMTKKVAEDRLKIQQQLADFTARELEKERINMGSNASSASLDYWLSTSGYYIICYTSGVQKTVCWPKKKRLSGRQPRSAWKRN